MPAAPQDSPNPLLCFKELISSLIFVTPAVTLLMGNTSCDAQMSPCGAGREQPSCPPQQCIPQRNPVNFWNKEGLSHAGKAQSKCLLCVLRALLSNQPRTSKGNWGSRFWPPSCSWGYTFGFLSLNWGYQDPAFGTEGLDLPKRIMESLRLGKTRLCLEAQSPHMTTTQFSSFLMQQSPAWIQG